MSRITKSWEFAQVPSEILLAPISANAKLLFTLYCLYSSRDGQLHPGNKRLGELMGGISPDTISRAKKELVKHEFIEVNPRFLEGRRTTDSIHLLYRTGADRIRTHADTGHRTHAATEVDPKEREETFSPHGTHAAHTSASVGELTPPPDDQAEQQLGLSDALLLSDEERRKGKEHLRVIRERQFHGTETGSG